MDPPEDEPCEQCGLCCRIFGPGITPTAANVYVWIEQGRTDILRWYIAFMDGGTQVPCTSLTTEDLGNAVSFEMRNPETGDYMPVCPFLRRVAKNRYLWRDSPGQARDVLPLRAVDLGRDLLQQVHGLKKDR